MNKVQVFGLLLFCAAILFSCKSDVAETDPIVATDPRITIHIDTKYHDEPFEVEQVYYDDLGHRIRVDNFMSYISMLSLVKEDGSEVLLRDFYLANFNTDHTFSCLVDPGSYKGIKFGLGVPHEYNKHVDPTIYPNDHALSIPGSQGMFWQWNTGYIFTKFEGKADTLGVEGNPLLDPFSFHIGDDPFYRSFENTTLDFTLEENGTKNLEVTIHVDKILFGENDQIDLATDFITHTEDNIELATRFVDNFTAAISVE